eukprot:3252827-Amphidinium_carterae.6
MFKPQKKGKREGRKDEQNQLKTNKANREKKTKLFVSIWWTDCEFPITCNSDLIQDWKLMNELIAGQMKKYTDAGRNSQHADCNMPSIYRRLRQGMDDRIRRISTQPNYGRGIPVLVSGYELSPITLELLGHKARFVDREEAHRRNMAVLQELDNPDLSSSDNRGRRRGRWRTCLDPRPRTSNH